MGASYTVKPSFDNVILPDGRNYRSGATVVLSSANVALLTSTMLNWLTLVNASVSDPTPPSIYANVDSIDDIRAALIALDARVTASGH